MSKKILGLFILGVGLYFGFSRCDYSEESKGFQLNLNEKFNPQLSRLNTIEKTQLYIDSIYTQNYRKFDSFEYMRTVIKVVKDKFYHGSAMFHWRENWIAYLLGKVGWSHFNSLVSPNEVIKHSSAMCSQQTMVFTRLLSLKGYTYRYIYLKNINGALGHFCCEIYIDNSWRFVDVNQEPNWSKIKGGPNQNIEFLNLNEKLEPIYADSYDFMQSLISNGVFISQSEINPKIGLKMMAFQWTTKILSWASLIILGLFLILKKN